MESENENYQHQQDQVLQSELMPTNYKENITLVRINKNNIILLQYL